MPEQKPADRLYRSGQLETVAGSRVRQGRRYCALLYRFRTWKPDNHLRAWNADRLCEGCRPARVGPHAARQGGEKVQVHHRRRRAKVRSRHGNRAIARTARRRGGALTISASFTLTAPKPCTIAPPGM